jgi:hypothetical protein
MQYTYVNRPKATVRIVPGSESLIGKTRQGRVGLVSKRYTGASVQEGEIWLVDVVHDYDNFFIMIPIEKIRNATEETQGSAIAD